MSPSIIKSKQSQLKIFQELHENLKKRFSSSEKRDHYDFLRGYKGSDDLAKFGLDFWMRHSWVGISLWGPPINGSADSKNVLGFATYSPRSPIGSTAGALPATPEESRSITTVVSLCEKGLQRVEGCDQNQPLNGSMTSDVGGDAGALAV
jgi:hypothetical protein